MCVLRAMVDAAWRWGTRTQNIRRNVIHQEEEIYLVLTETFELSDEQSQEIAYSGSATMEDSRV